MKRVWGFLGLILLLLAHGHASPTCELLPHVCTVSFEARANAASQMAVFATPTQTFLRPLSFWRTVPYPVPIGNIAGVGYGSAVDDRTILFYHGDIRLLHCFTELLNCARRIDDDAHRG